MTEAQNKATRKQLRCISSKPKSNPIEVGNEAQTNLGPQHVARDDTLELLLGSAPCDSNSLITPCTT